MRGVPQLDSHRCKTPAPCPDLEPGPLCPPTKPEMPHAKTLVEDPRGGGGHLEHLHSRGRRLANRRFPKPIARDLPCSSVRSEETTMKESHRMKRSYFVVNDGFIERGFWCILTDKYGNMLGRKEPFGTVHCPWEEAAQT